MKELYNIVDYSIQIFKKLFWRLTLISLVINVPFILAYNYISGYLEFFKTITVETAFIVTGLFIAQLMYFFIVSPLFTAYIIMKTYIAYTETIGDGLYRLNITFRSLISKIPHVILYNIIMLMLILFSFLTVIPAMYILIYYVSGYEGLAMFLPKNGTTLNIDLWSGLINFFLSLGGFIWLGYFIARVMFGMQAMFIENYKGISSVIRSFYITKNEIKLLGYVVLIAFLFVLWTGSSIFIGFCGYSLYAYNSIDLMSKSFNMLLNIIFFVSAIYFNIAMTVAYIYLKIKRDALGLEFKMLRMMGKQTPLSGDVVNFRQNHVIFESMVKSKATTREKAGVISRFCAYLVDSLIVAVGLLILGIVILNILPQMNLTVPESIKQIINLEKGYFNIILILIIIYGMFNIAYMTICEFILGGQTPGKKLVGIIVFDKFGNRPRFSKVLIRNILRIIDFLPLVFVGGFLTIVFNKNEQRIGDFLSSTYVVRNDESNKIEPIKSTYIWGSNLPQTKNIYPISDGELEILTEFLGFEELPPERKAFFAYNLNIYFSLKFEGKNKYANPFDFFRDIVRMNEN